MFPTKFLLEQTPPNDSHIIDRQSWLAIQTNNWKLELDFTKVILKNLTPIELILKYIFSLPAFWLLRKMRSLCVTFANNSCSNRKHTHILLLLSYPLTPTPYNIQSRHQQTLSRPSESLGWGQQDHKLGKRGHLTRLEIVIGHRDE